MPAPADQFQRRTFVRLPFADLYLEQRDERLWKEELRRAFARPLLVVRIAGNAEAGEERPDPEKTKADATKAESERGAG